MKITTAIRSCPIRRDSRLEALDIRDQLIDRLNSLEIMDTRTNRRLRCYMIIIDRNLYGVSGGVYELQ